MNDQPHYLTFSPEIAVDPGGGIPTGFSGVAYSGGVVPNYGWFGDCAIDMASVQIPERMFALVNHDDDERAGHCRVWIEGSAIHVSGQFSKITEAGQSVAGEFAEKAPWKLSVGFNANTETQQPPRAVELNGQTLVVGTIFRNARILEVSFVPSDADPNTSVAAFAAAPAMPAPASTQQETHAMSNDTAQQIAELKAQLSAANERANAAETALAESRKTSRLGAVKTLFETLGHEWDDAKAAPYLDMSDAAFAAVSADLRDARPAPDPSLFTAVATHGKTADGETPVKLSATDVYAERRQQARKALA